MGDFKQITSFSLQFLIVITSFLCFLNSVRSNPIDDKILEFADYTLQDLVDRYENTDRYNFWHPNTFKTGVQSREVIKVSGITKRWIPGVYKQWKYAQLGSGIVIVGLTDQSIDFYDETLRQIGTIQSYERLVALTTFSEWNDKLGRPELIVIVATRLPSLQSYSFTNETVLNLGRWPLPNTVKSLELCTVEMSRKIIVVAENNHAPVDIYNFEVDHNSSQLWFFQRINEEKRSCLTVHEVDSSCSIAIASEQKISVYSFEPRMGYFDEQTKFVNISTPCQQFISFSLAYSEYMAHVPPAQYNQGVEFFSETGKDYLNQNSDPIHATEVVALPAGDYRDEDIILARTPFNTTRILSYDGLKKMFRETFLCTPEICPIETGLSNGVGTLINGTTVYFAPTQKDQDYATVLIVSSVIEEYTSPLYDRARQLYSEFHSLSEKYIRFQTIVSHVEVALGDAISTSSPNIINGNWTVKELSSFNAQIYQETTTASPFNARQNFQNIEFLNVHLLAEDFAISDDETERRLEAFQGLISTAEERAARAVPLDSQEMIQVSAAQSLNDGLIQAPFVRSSHAVIHGVNNDVMDLGGFFGGFALLEDSGSTLHIKRNAIFSGALAIRNLEAGEINNIPTKDYAILSSKNVFNSPVEFTSRFNALENIEASLVAGYRFPDDIIDATNIKGVTLNNVVALDRAHVSVPIRSVKIDVEEFERDILSTDTLQNITSHIAFNNIVLRENGILNHLNNQNFVQVVNSIVLKNHDGIIRGTKLIQSDNITASESLTILETLNSTPFPTAFVSVHDKVIDIQGPKNFDYISANSVGLNGTINRVNTNNMVRKHTSKAGEFIHSDWKLLDSVNFMGDVQLKETVGEVNFSDLYFKDTFDEEKSQYYPNHHVVFEAPVQLEYLHVQDRVNGKTFEESFGNALICDEGTGDVFVRGVTTFQRDVVFGNLNIRANQVNGINLDNFFHRNKEQNITNKNFIFSMPITFTDLVAASEVDSVNLQSVFRDSLYLNKIQQPLPPGLIFESIVSTNDVNVQGPINNFEHFGHDVAVKAGRQEQIFDVDLILDEAEIKLLYVAENLAALGNFDGLNITHWVEERISLSDDAVLFQPVEVLGKVIVQNEINTNTLNGRSLEFLESGVLRKDKLKQEFLSPVGILDEIQVQGNVQFDSTLNGYYLANIIRDSIPIHGVDVENISGHWHIENAVFGNLQVEGTACGVDVVGLDSDSVRENSRNVTFKGVTTFLGKIQAENQIETNLLNSAQFSSNMFTLHTPQVITSGLVWKNDVNFESDVHITGKVNDVSLEELSSIYSFDGVAHSLNSSVKFTSSFATQHLQVDGLIQHRNLTQYLPTVVYKSSNAGNNQQQVVTGNVNFTQPIISHGEVTTAESYNGLNVPALSQAVVRKNGAFTFSSPVTFRQPVYSKAFYLKSVDISTIDGVVGSLNTQEIQDNSIPLHSEEPVYSEKLIFENLLVHGNIEGAQSVNNIPLTDFITLDSEQAVGTLKIANLAVTQKNITVGGLFGNIDVVEDFTNTVMTSIDEQVYPDRVISGRKEFKGKVTVNGGFECLGQDKMSQLVYIQEPNQRINARVAFEDDFVTTGNMDITTQKWNNYSLSELKNCALSKYGDDVISADWSYNGGLVFANLTESHGLIDGVNMTKLEQESRIKVDRAERLIMEEQSKYHHYCHHFQKLVSYSSRSPLKLQSFDEQQLIISKKSVQSMLTVKSGTELYLLVTSEACGVFVYRWSIEHEQFYDYRFVFDLETVDKWVQASSENYGIIVLSSSYSNCNQEMDTGLYFSILSESGSVSPKMLISNGSVVDFKLVTDDSKSTTLLFVVYQDHPGDIVVYSWQKASRTFSTETTLTMSTLITTMDVNQPRGDGNVEILLQTALRVSIFIYSSLQRSVTELNHAEFYGSSNSMKMFEADKSLYALVLSKNSDRSSIKPDCSVQLFQATNGELQFVQKLPVYDLVAMEVVRIREQVYVLVLTKPVGLYIYKFMGLAGLQPINHHPLKFHHGENLNAFHITPWRYNTSLPFVLVSSRNSIKLYHTNILGNAISDDSSDLENGEDNYFNVCNL